MVFGDIFGQRGDYTKGLFYSGRNGIFSHENNKAKKNAPVIIRKNILMKSIEGGKQVEDLSTTPSTPKLETNQFANILKFKMGGTEQNEFRKNAKTIIQTIVIDHPANQWNLEVHGGLKMWVNSRTGEVSVEDPSKSDAPSKRRAGGTVNSSRRFTWRVAGPKSIRRGGGSNKIHPINSIRETSCQNEDMNELLKMLDGNQPSEKFCGQLRSKCS